MRRSLRALDLPSGSKQCTVTQPAVLACMLALL